MWLKQATGIVYSESLHDIGTYAFTDSGSIDYYCYSKSFNYSASSMLSASLKADALTTGNYAEVVAFINLNGMNLSANYALDFTSGPTYGSGFYTSTTTNVLLPSGPQTVQLCMGRRYASLTANSFRSIVVIR